VNYSGSKMQQVT